MVTAALLLSACLQDAGPSLEKAAEFARGLEEAVAKGEFITFDLALDPDAFYDRVVGEVKLPPAAVEFLKPVIRMSFTSTPIFAVLKGRVTYKFLKARKADDGFRALFRMTGQGTSFHYHELLLIPEGGGFKVVDYFILNLGDFQSDLVRRVMIPTPEMMKILKELIAPTAGDFMMDYNSKPINKISQLFTAGQFKEVLEVYEENSALFKTVKIAQVLRINAAANIDQASHQKAVDEMQRAFKDEPAVVIASLGGYQKYGPMDKALETMDRIEKIVGGDVFLNVQRAKVYLEAKDPAKARDLAAIVTEKEPTLDHGWWARIGAHLALKEYKDVARCLTLAEKALGVEFDDLKSSPSYSEFVKSPEYAEWMKGRGGK